LREAQSLTQSVIPNGGQAVIIDTGEANDIHPRNKREVAARLARLALARDYGLSSLPAHSPEFKNISITGDKVTVAFNHVSGGLRAHDDSVIKGFAICGEDRKWVWAEAQLNGQRDQIVVSSAAVPAPVAVRYAWADNPVCNVVSAAGLPLTPFRSDDFPMVTAPKP
jgi:sialate O-acetylesterase